MNKNLIEINDSHVLVTDECGNITVIDKNRDKHNFEEILLLENKIETIEKSNKLLVSVKDNGIGIPKDNIKQIWDRFYKTDLSRGKDKKGTGLGLSITKEIIHSHNENINVISTEGVGTEFIFTLEKTSIKD